MKKFLALTLAFIMVFACVLFAACMDNFALVVLHPNNGDSVRIIHYYSGKELPDDYRKEGYDFDGWYYDEAFFRPFKSTDEISGRVDLYAKWKVSGNKPGEHTHDFGDNYFMFVECSVEGCDVMGRTIGDDAFKQEFVYDYTDAKQAELDAFYNGIVESVTNGDVSVDTVISQFNEYDSQFTYIEYQYQVSTVLCSVNYDDEWIDIADKMEENYNAYIQNYYLLLGLIDGSKYKNEFFAEWSKEEYDYAIEMANMYSASDDNLQTEANKIASQYNSLLNAYSNNPTDASLQKLYQAYGEFVAANNNIAAQYGSKYSDFMDYSYEKDYNREYTPSEVASMRQYVKQYISPLLTKVYNAYSRFNGFTNYDNLDYYAGLAADSLFTIDTEYAARTYTATNRIGDYFKFLNNNVTGAGEINYYKYANKLFKDGNYFSGSEEGAYTYWIVDKNQSVLFFGDNYDDDYGSYDYSTAFTFVHEFGHYYNGIFNGNISLSMDHDETQSQGNEMLFLAWLNENKPANISDGYKILECEQLFNILCSIVQSTIVDEFEQAVYSNSYGEGAYKNGISPSDYGKVYSAILDSYGTGISAILGTEYWMYVAVSSPAYYISYAMSALPSLELFVKAQKDGLTAARSSYFKLYDFSRNTNVADADGDGNVTYREALAYAGLDNPFSQTLYTTINNYLKNYSI